MGWTRTDDLRGEGVAHQQTFGLNGKAYAIDLNEDNAARLQKALQPFLTVATVYGELPAAPEVPQGPEVAPATLPRPVRVPAPARRRGKASLAVPPQATIREWANTHGYQVSPKGRIPDAVLAEYTRANPPG